MELLVPVVGIGWHFRRQVLAGVLICLSCAASGYTVLYSVTQKTKVSTLAVAEKAAVAYVAWSQRKDTPK